MNPAPDALKALGALQMVGGLANMTVGWLMASTLWSLGGGLCTGILTCGLCPIGSLCGVASWLILPVGMAEVVIGLLLLSNPGPVKGLLPYLPWLQVPMLILGDFVSPILGILTGVMAAKPEVAGYIEDL